MICKYCGMDSTTTNKCSWCGRELTAVPVEQEETDAATEEAIAEAGTETEQETNEAAAPLQAASATGKAKTALTKRPRPAPGVPPPGARRRAPVPARPVPTTRAASAALDASEMNPALARATALNANLALNAVQELTLATPPIFAPTSNSLAESPTDAFPQGTEVETEPTIIVTDILATPQEAVTAGAEGETALPVKKKRRRPVRDEDIMGVSGTFLLARYIVVMALIFVITGGLSYLLHDRTGLRFSGWAIGPLLIAEFLGGLLLPILRIGPWIDDDAEDLVWFVLFTLMFGPVVSLICYGVLCMIRHSYNASLLGCMVIAAVARFGLMVTTHDYDPHLLTPFSNFHGWTISFMFINWMGFVTLGGWYLASVFRGLDQ